MPERTIKSIEVDARRWVHSIEIGNKYADKIVEDIIERDGQYMLFDQNDELIAEINLPVLCVRYQYDALEVC
ncbi:hypothetical protein [Bacillus massiliglaciei]|uniref:hypothetical protein n=1 Tax=Bacillus massiliglaciei TaxID=1816693 RepID=UPI000DA63221|nr:hypothetical protein [Bacillus massiliglaciei]